MSIESLALLCTTNGIAMLYNVQHYEGVVGARPAARRNQRS